jgi:signal transduction histidine kinase
VGKLLDRVQSSRFGVASLSLTLPLLVLCAEILGVAWLGIVGIAPPLVAAVCVIAMGGVLLWTLRAGEEQYGTGGAIGLAVGLAGLLWTAAVSNRTLALVPAVVLTAAVLVALLLDRQRAPQPDAIECELAARVDELARTKDQLLAIVSHEFRTPVTGVMGFARTMSNHFASLDQETMRLFVRSIEDHSTRLARLVENLVIASDGVDVDPVATCDVHRVVTSVVSTIDDTGHDIQVGLRGGRLAQIDGDAARRVIANLVDNAVKFADPDTLVRVEVRPLGGDVVLDVTNVGPPLPADLRERLYQPFVQADSSDSRRADGLGLGLHVVRQLVEAHGGRVELVEGGGLVTFRVRLRPARALASPTAAPLS